MTIFFVSRHPGARQWARSQGIRAQWVDHLDPAQVAAGDLVIGTLPVPLVAEVCQRGARYVHLVLDLPRALRGVELDVAQMAALCPRLVAYDVRPVTGE